MKLFWSLPLVGQLLTVSIAWGLVCAAIGFVIGQSPLEYFLLGSFLFLGSSTLGAAIVWSAHR